MTRYISYKSTGFFSQTVIDYIDENEMLRPFYRHPVSFEGVREAIESRKYFPTNRQLLHEVLTEQYASFPLHEKVRKNIDLLQQENTFTITTAHQPNIFTGPLYFIYKILHAVRMADELQQKFPEKHFVPVYYMGSEDADLAELNHIEIQEKKYEWHTRQTGAVGRMQVDDDLLELIKNIKAHLGVLPFGNEWADLLGRAYTKEKNIQQATLALVNDLFAEFGLVILIPDNARLKKVFEPVVEKELLEQFSQKEVAKTAAALNNNGYKIQASGREINLFYLLDDHRERIELINGSYVINNLNRRFSQEEILKEVKEHPERFSANVVLRGLFQEIILPNIIFIGGGGELAYWLELKKVFDRAGAPYPMLVLRNSFLLLNEEQQNALEKLALPAEHLFKKEFEILDFITQKKGDAISLEKEKKALKNVYEEIKAAAAKADATLAAHTEALFVQADKKVDALQKKISRAQRRLLHEETRRVKHLKQRLFPHDSLQERVDNFGYIYSLYGKSVLKDLYNASKTLQPQFCILTVYK